MTRRVLLRGIAIAGAGAVGTGLWSTLIGQDAAAAAQIAPAVEPVSAAGPQAVHTFALTFDDGPHVAALGGGTNRTERVLDVLRDLDVRGAFFIQTGLSHRGNHPVGRKLVARMAAEGHTVGVHTGGTIDHESHPDAQAAGRLEAELEAAIAYIQDQTGQDPRYVRPPGGRTNPAVLATYARVGLTSLMWDVDGDQGKNLALPALQQRLRAQLGAVAGRKWVGTTAAAPTITVLYHDIQAGTAANVAAMVDGIRSLTAELSDGRDRAAFSAP